MINKQSISKNNQNNILSHNNTQKYQIVFDMDGTLYSSENMILPSYQRGITAFNNQYHHIILTLPSLEKIISLLGFPIEIIYNTLFPNLNSENQIHLRKLILDELIKSIENKEGILYDGVIDTILQLHKKGHQLYIASNGQWEYLNAIIRTYQLLPYFNPIITLNYTSICDKGDILLEYQKKYNFNISNTIMIGDRDSDMHAADKLGCQFIACQYGHGDPSETNSAQLIVHSISEIINIIK